MKGGWWTGGSIWRRGTACRSAASVTIVGCEGGGAGRERERERERQWLAESAKSKLIWSPFCC